MLVRGLEAISLTLTSLRTFLREQVAVLLRLHVAQPSLANIRSARLLSASELPEVAYIRGDFALA